MKNHKINLLFVLFLVSFVLAAGCGKKDQTQPQSNTTDKQEIKPSDQKRTLPQTIKIIKMSWE